jgi:HSP20 family protein
MSLLRYEPVRGFGQFQNEINNALSVFDHQTPSRNATSWTPAVDVTEYKDRYVLAVELPGIAPEAVEITLDEGVLQIQGETADVESDDSIVHRRAERRAGHFKRRFQLPEEVDVENVKASNQNGVLEIAIPKQEKAKPRRIEIAAQPQN